MIGRLLRALAGQPTPSDAGRALARRAAQVKAAARRAATIDHLTSFGPYARLDRLNEGSPNV